MNEKTVYASVLSLCLLISLLAWATRSYFQAKAYNRITGQNVSTWDAMCVELRVISGPGDAYGMKLEAIHEVMDKEGAK